MAERPRERRTSLLEVVSIMFSPSLRFVVNELKPYKDSATKPTARTRSDATPLSLSLSSPCLCNYRVNNEAPNTRPRWDAGFECHV